VKRGEALEAGADGKARLSVGGAVADQAGEQAAGGPGGQGDQFAVQMEKKMAEVEMGLLHLQQNIEIPEIVIAINPVVLQIMGKCLEAGRKPRVDDFTALVEDTNFLNALQAGVSRWIREIKKVTKLDRDPSSGTALQEISFWLSLERALNRILEKRESLEVTLTLDILRYGKRFIATVSFDSDTGLKEAIEVAKDYNNLMKDFPLNELMGATELPAINSAIQSIFAHMKKASACRTFLNGCDSKLLNLALLSDPWQQVPAKQGTQAHRGHQQGPFNAAAQGAQHPAAHARLLRGL
jgi:dynein heavy chain 1